METDDRRAALKRMNYVVRLWQAFADGGVEGMAPLVPPDVEWSPPDQDGVLHGTAELADFMDRHPERDMPMPVAYEAHHEDVLVHAERLVPTGGTSHVWLLYRFQDQRLVEALSFDDEARARAALRDP